ncbi:MAG: hypothetical protein WCT04_23185 [Planctomycetota bacterium]
METSPCLRLRQFTNRAVPSAALLARSASSGPASQAKTMCGADCLAMTPLSSVHAGRGLRWASAMASGLALCHDLGQAASWNPWSEVCFRRPTGRK